MNNTFSAFDTGLAEITQHLSGTIADIRETTESVPHLILKSQKQCEETLKTLEEQTDIFVQTMRNSVAQMIDSVDALGGGSSEASIRP